jgi:hypothetical protein
VVGGAPGVPPQQWGGTPGEMPGRSGVRGNLGPASVPAAWPDACGKESQLPGCGSRSMGQNPGPPDGRWNGVPAR